MLRPLILAACIFFILQFLKKTFQSSYTSPTKPSRNPYEILGIEKNASKEQIKQAYHQQLAQNHPDKVAHMSKDIQATAHAKTHDIQWAFEQLR
ncbi:MAG: J domain-containing protein [Bdellovibrionota bacterium]|nr:J domain-containing protein [Deltaproteobacteria bacterium]